MLQYSTNKYSWNLNIKWFWKTYRNLKEAKHISVQTRMSNYCFLFASCPIFCPQNWTWGHQNWSLKYFHVFILYLQIIASVTGDRIGYLECIDNYCSAEWKTVERVIVFTTFRELNITKVVDSGMEGITGYCRMKYTQAKQSPNKCKKRWNYMVCTYTQRDTHKAWNNSTAASET